MVGSGCSRIGASPVDCEKCATSSTIEGRVGLDAAGLDCFFRCASIEIRNEKGK
jgi:hypothetical protein